MNSTEAKPDDRAESKTPAGPSWMNLWALTVDDLADLQWISAPKIARADRRPQKGSTERV